MFWNKTSQIFYAVTLCPQICFFAIFYENVAFFEKIVRRKNIYKISFSIKKVTFIFVGRRPLPFKKDWDPKNSFTVFSENRAFFEKTVK